jgi:predicted nucleic acid-binding protein
VAPTLRIADAGAYSRAEYNLRTPDAIQAATALSHGATGFVSNDAGFRRVAGLDVRF